MQVARQKSDGTFEVISEFQSDAFGDYNTPRIAVQDSICLRIKKEDGEGPIHLTTLKYNEGTNRTTKSSTANNKNKGYKNKVKK